MTEHRKLIDAANRLERRANGEPLVKVYPSDRGDGDPDAASYIEGVDTAIVRDFALPLIRYIQEHEASDGVITRRLLWANEAAELLTQLANEPYIVGSTYRRITELLERAATVQENTK